MPKPILSFLEGLVFDRRPLVIALFAVITLVMAWFATQLRIDAGFAKLLPLEHEYMKTFVEHRTQFGGANRILIALMAKDGDMFTPDFFEALQAVTDEVFFIPGVTETLRVNGKAGLTRDPVLLEPLAAQGKVPDTGILVEVEEAFLHCGKALIRSRLWNPESRIDRKSFPTLGRMIADQIGGLDAEETEDYVQESYRERLY